MKLIGLTPSTSATQRFLNTDYTSAFTREGICPITLPIFTIENREALDQEAFEALHAERIDSLTEACSGLVCSGGSDANPVSFGETNYSSFGCDSERDMMEKALIKSFIDVNKPIFGICKGFQMLALSLGLGHYQQDISVTGEAHSGSSDPYAFKDRQEPMHLTDVFGEYRDYLRAQLGRPNLSNRALNSMHHQGVTITENGKRPTLKQMLQYREDTGGEQVGYWDIFAAWRQEQITAYEAAFDVRILSATPMVIEGFERVGAGIVAHQNHPESSGPTSLAIGYWLSRYVLNDD